MQVLLLLLTILVTPVPVPKSTSPFRIEEIPVGIMSTIVQPGYHSFANITYTDPTVGFVPVTIVPKHYYVPGPGSSRDTAIDLKANMFTVGTILSVTYFDSSSNLTAFRTYVIV